MTYTKPVDSVFRAHWLATQTQDCLRYSPLGIVLDFPYFSGQKKLFGAGYSHELLRDARENRLPRWYVSVALGLTRASRNNAAGYFRARSLACSFRSTIPERKERLLVVYTGLKYTERVVHLGVGE